MTIPRPPRSRPRGAAAGADVGATLVKLAVRDASGATSTCALPADALDAVAQRLRDLAPNGLGLTGGGAPRLAELLAHPAVMVGEFEAWAEGARRLLAHNAPTRFLVVSVGTGTSAMLVDADAVTRAGGTALGGGAILGLAAALFGERDFDAIAALAQRGDRRRVDLLISDIYPAGDFLLPGDANAASFAKLARADRAPADAADLAHAIMGLVGENIALICTGLAARADVELIAFGGSTLRANPALTAILGGGCAVLGCKPHFLADGQYAGALGALALAEADLEQGGRRNRPQVSRSEPKASEDHQTRSEAKPSEGRNPSASD
jgi:type II pantothenate kinase